MKISFVGGGKRLSACLNIFNGKTGFTLNGVFSNPLEACADAAVIYNMKIYRSLDSLYTDSDVIVLALSDRHVPGIISALGRLHAHGKLFVTTSEVLTSSELSIAYPNACAIINTAVPIDTMTPESLCSASFVCQLFGKNYGEFRNIMEASEINCKFLSSKQLQLYRTSLHMARYTTEAAISAAIQLLKISAVTSDENHLVPILKNALKAALEGENPSPNSPYAEGSLYKIKKHLEILSENGIESTKNLYGAAAVYLTEKKCRDFEAADEIIRYINNS